MLIKIYTTLYYKNLGFSLEGSFLFFMLNLGRGDADREENKIGPGLEP